MKLEIYNMLNAPFEKPALEDTLTPMTIQLVMQAYASMGEHLRRFIENELGYNSYLMLIDGIRSSVNTHLNNALQPGKVEPPLIPLITGEAVKEWIDRMNSKMIGLEDTSRRILVVFAVAAYCYETRVLWTVDRDLHNNSLQILPPSLIAELENYGFWKTVHRRDTDGFDMFGTRRAVEAFTTEQTNRIEQTLTRIAASTVEMQQLFFTTKEDIDKLMSDTTGRVSETSEKVLKIETEVTFQQKNLEAITESIVTNKENVNAFANAVREELKTSTTKELWRNRGDTAEKSFWMSAGIVAFLIIAPLILLFFCGAQINEGFFKLTNASFIGLGENPTAIQVTAATVGRLVLITAPLALYFWAIKLIVRFNTRCMILMDDARQRHTTMDTYFHLIERNGATPEERGLMLNALFRPLPGQGQENVEPPNFMELVKKTE
ncbi:DUF6161 domain-containing protein [Agrobacterium leguminum]|uniref:DUF6161 domain-containing protein n=1 Tax=Agrobacterium leguminum TaxID=2792015 RepID=UPI0022B84EAC|nr:DUF6161 domain-containing protein [Agrobacterium leguminum]MCZ7934651.1 DUF6161 domain-containing protein [Agrobacterium leguminum]